MKTIFEFNLSKETEVEETITEVKENGEKISTTKKVPSKVSVKLGIKKPSRSQMDDAELFYGIRLNEGIRAGLMTRPQIAKRITDDGGVLSDSQKEEYSRLFASLFEKEELYTKVNVKPKEILSPEEQTSIENLPKEMAKIKERLQELEMFKQSVFNCTAENRARDKTIIWWVLNLAYFEKESKWVPFFGEGNLNEKFAQFDIMDEEANQFNLNAISRFLYLISSWYVGGAQSIKDFEELLISFNPVG
jgi:hypothetical protein